MPVYFYQTCLHLTFQPAVKSTPVIMRNCQLPTIVIHHVNILKKQHFEEKA